MFIVHTNSWSLDNAGPGALINHSHIINLTMNHGYKRWKGNAQIWVCLVLDWPTQLPSRMECNASRLIISGWVRPRVQAYASILDWCGYCSLFRCPRFWLPPTIDARPASTHTHQWPRSSAQWSFAPTTTRRCQLKMELISKFTYACFLPMILIMIPELERLKIEVNPKHPYRN